ncbi:MAG TPA: DUF4442 domain-containing protein [Spirochaetota bacterium]
MESFASKIARWRFNFYPAYRGTGARIIYIAGDWHEVRVKLPLSWRTRNYVGTIFGGSIYGAVDPVYMLMLMKKLGPEYIVWDKAAYIQFKRPGTSTLFATFIVTDEEISAIRNISESARSFDRIYNVDLVDGNGTIHASVEKVIYFRRKSVIDEK